MEPIYLWEHAPYYDPSIKGQAEPSLQPFLLPKTRKKRPAVIIFPGGAYVGKAVDHEGIQIAQWLNSFGYDAFVVDYRVSPYRHPVELTDANRAVRFVRFHASEYGINPRKIGVLGFSAGGHLAASASLHCEKIENPADEIDRSSAKPNFSVFCYPVITTGKGAHDYSIQMLLGEKYGDPELMKYMSLEKQVKKSSPPAFIWTTAEDTGVPPVQNAVALALAYWKKGVICDLHVFQYGGHGLGLAPSVPTTAQWADLCREWLKKTVG